MVCTYIQAEFSLSILIILESSIYDEGVLSRRGLCLEGVIFGGGVCPKGFCPIFIMVFLYLYYSNNEYLKKYL